MGVLAVMTVSDAVWLALIGVLTMIVKEHFDRLRANDAKKEVETVKATLQQSTAESKQSRAEDKGQLKVIAETGEKVHVLVNSKMAAQLALTAGVTRRLADLTKEPIDEAAADTAEALMKEHEGKQVTVDEKPPEDGEVDAAERRG